MGRGYRSAPADATGAGGTQPITMEARTAAEDILGATPGELRMSSFDPFRPTPRALVALTLSMIAPLAMAGCGGDSVTPGADDAAFERHARCASSGDAAGRSSFPHARSA